MKAKVAVVVLLLLTVGASVTSLGTGEPANRSSPAGPPAPALGAASTPAARAGAVADVLFAQQRAVERRDQAEFAATFARTPRATELGDMLSANLTRLPLTSYSQRYLGGVTWRGDERWTGDVQVRWGLVGHDERPVTTTLRATFVGSADGARITRLTSSPGTRTPIWLLGRLSVRRAGSTLVVSARPALTVSIAALAPKAVRDVRRVLPRWRGGMVVTVPPSLAGMERMLTRRRESYARFAAVMITADGTADPTAPAHIVVNPAVFARLGTTAARAVLAHEATHVATDATSSFTPLWLMEGFADYVALAGKPVPLKVAAGRALRRVRREGPPATLPRPRDFSTGSDIGATYEVAWLACRLIARRHGEDALVRFYHRADRPGGARRAFTTVLGRDRRAFVRQWQRHLERLA